MNSQPIQDTKDSDNIVIRHKIPDRIYHWIMATAVIVLLATAFLPIAGLKFPWVTVHWIAGVILCVIVIVHIVRALIWQDRASMNIGLSDIKHALQAFKWVLRTSKQPPDRPGKYPLLQKLYHHGITAIVLLLIATGGLMLAKIDTPFWQRNPYMLSAETWGYIYVLHDLAAMAVLALLMIHIYFAIRPEKLWITRSMILGWITRQEYHDNHDPEAWVIETDKSK